MMACALLLTVATVANAVPAKRGVWKTLTMADGTKVKAQLMGDEHMHFWMTDDGQRLTKADNGTWQPTTTAQLKAKRKARTARNAKRTPRLRATIGERTHFTGTKKGLVILANFTDVKFKTANNKAKYNNILNTPGYTSDEGFEGSVADYFKAQSGGVFELKFDVVGPITLAHNRKYYGANDPDDNDLRPEDMIVEACNAVNSQVNFADYDWDGDGEVDQVFVLYAGTGEADSDDEDAIWPHEWELSIVDKSITLDGVVIDTYACSNEVDAYGDIEGIGVFCHEFSHCLGFPDFYDIMYDGNFGMSEFDLMDMGSYNGGGFVPAGYSAHEKMMAGWLEPIELSDADMQVGNLKAQSEGGAAYIIYNKAHPDEYYMLENRQQTGWDAELPDAGLMISHIDFDLEVWQNNIPNSVMTLSEAREMGLTCGNDHQRNTIFHADNDDDSKYWNSSKGYYTKTTLQNDLYPYNRNDSLTATSKPAATLYNANTNGKKMMGRAITGIKQNSNGSIDFNYRAVDNGTGGTVTGGTIFYESFDQCSGTGGNDDLWSNNIANATFVPDNDDWIITQARGGDRCARFGTGKVVGIATTPAFDINGEVTMTFMAGAWKNDGTALALDVEGNATITPSVITIGNAEWAECTVTLEGNGEVRVTFTPQKRFFLDEVTVTSGQQTQGIVAVDKQQKVRPVSIYTIDGRYVGADKHALTHGIYIVNGKKVVK